MRGIDYSKWDKLNCSTSSSGSSRSSADVDENVDDEEGAYRDSGGAPKVTRLQYPSRVTLGPNGVQLDQAPPAASASPFAGAAPRPPVQHPAPSSSTSGHDAGESAKVGDSAAMATVCGGVDDAEDDEDLLFESLARNGGREGAHHWWTQTEDTATVSFLVPWETTGKSVTLFRLYETQEKEEGALERCRAHLEIHISPSPPTPVAAASARLTGPPSPAAPLCIHGVLRFPVKLTEDLIDGCWQLHRMPKRHLRLLVVQLFKEPVGHGMTLWWDRCFTTDTQSVIADPHAIPDRVRRAATVPGSSEKAAQFRQVWAEAHEEFRRRRGEEQRRRSSS
ncbi:hypothetical protein NESM_000502300 [Novymonas esmeraldas]|uniref:Uncharacterized protein n=1 Tax=Novymonas esmeraldas TaxID=1808958 RepID=A0AAW0EPV1_9TRYP